MEEKKKNNNREHFFSEECEKSERELLAKKTLYYIEKTKLPKGIVQPVQLLFDENGTAAGYVASFPDYPVISLLELFQKENIEKYHVDGHLLLTIAKKVLYLLMDLSDEGIYPGLISLDSIFVHKERPNKAVTIGNIEHFQAGDLPSTFPWYPSDSKLFETELTLFDRETQKKADAKLIYKILTVSARGNAKIPPNPKTQELSYLFWNILSREWKDYFLSLSDHSICYEDIMDLLMQSIREEQYYTHPSERQATEQVPLTTLQKNKEQKKKAYAAIVVLREAGKSAHDISRLLYLVQEKLEEDIIFSYEQAIILGDHHPYVKKFTSYPYGFRSQLAHKIRAYSFAETLIISCEVLEQAIKKDDCPSFCYLLLDGEIRNDILYSQALRKLEHLMKTYGVTVSVLSVQEHFGEGYQKLLDLCQARGKEKLI